MQTSSFLGTPDYFSAILPSLQSAGTLEAIGLVAVNILALYALAALFILVNVGFLAFVTWSMLGLCRLLGVPWVDGTTEGFIERS